MKFVLLLSGILLAGPLAARAETPWSYRAVSGEDASSASWHFFESDGETIVRIRSVWNGGAQGDPEVVDYRLEGGDIVIRRFAGMKDQATALAAGQDVPLRKTKEYRITSRDSKSTLKPPPPHRHLTDEQRIDLQNLIDLLALERKPYSGG